MLININGMQTLFYTCSLSIFKVLTSWKSLFIFYWRCQVFFCLVLNATFINCLFVEYLTFMWCRAFVLQM
jgi:hypothetical protein